MDENIFEEIIFLQGFEAIEALNLLEQQGERSVIAYLSQWHYPGEHMTGDFPAGTADSVSRQGNYVLSYNPSLEYIGLVSKIQTDQ